MVWDGLRLFNPNLPNIDVEYPVSTKSPSSICGFYGVVHSSTHTIRYGKIHSQLYTQVIRSLLWSMKNWGSKSTDKLWKSPKTIRKPSPNQDPLGIDLGPSWDSWSCFSKKGYHQPSLLQPPVSGEVLVAGTLSPVMLLHHYWLLILKMGIWL